MNVVEAEIPESAVSVSSHEISTTIDCNTSWITSGSGEVSGSDEVAKIFTSLLPDASSVGVSPEIFTVAVKFNVVASDEVVGVPVKINS